MLVFFLRVFMSLICLQCSHCFSSSDNELQDLQMAQIEILSRSIEETQYDDDSAQLDLYNERGIAYLFMEKYELALEDFNHVLKASYAAGQMCKPVFGAALWGRLLSHAYANFEKETLEDINLVRSYFLQEDCLGLNTSNRDGYFVVRVAKFANPKERISPAECKERVRGTANVMRLIALKIPNVALAGAVEYTISEIEYAAYNCCDRAHWTDCLGPIVDAWHYLKNCMDKGVAIAPKLLIQGK